MKRYHFTVTELLVVIAIIAILAALAAAVMINSRGKARLASCANNQGQTMKMMLAAMSSDGKLTSGNTDDTRYTRFLMDKGSLQSLEAVRCPDLQYATNPKNMNDSAARKEAYGMVMADDANKGKFNFKSNKIRRSGTVDIPSASLLMGGCTAAKFSPAYATAELDFSNGKLIPIHSGDTVNVFFFDGSVSSLTAEEFEAKNFYYPKADSSGAAAVEKGKLLTK